MKMGLAGTSLLVTLLLVAATSQADCLAGMSSSSTCVSGTNRIYGSGKSSSAFSQELLNSDSAASTTQGQSASKLIQRGVSGSGSSRSSAVRSALQNSGIGQKKSLGSNPFGSGSGRSGSSSKSSSSMQSASSSSSSLRASSISSRLSGHKQNAQGNSDVRSGAQNSLGESVDLFGNDAERDVHGSLVTCLKDSFGHQVCM